MSSFISEHINNRTFSDSVATTPARNTVGIKNLKNEASAVWVMELRRRTGLSMTQFAKTLGVSDPAVIDWETGKCRPTKPEARHALAVLGRSHGMPPLPEATNVKPPRPERGFPDDLRERFTRIFGDAVA